MKSEYSSLCGNAEALCTTKSDFLICRNNSTNAENDSGAPIHEQSSYSTPSSTSRVSSSRREDSTINSTSGANGPSTVTAEAEAAYSLGNPISTILNQLFG